MRKLMLCLVLISVFAIGLTVGMTTTPVEAGFCYWTCGCNGVVYKCCITPYGTACKLDPKAPFACPQIADC